MPEYSLKVVFNEQTCCAISSKVDVFSENMYDISKYASTFGGYVTDQNTITVPSSAAYIAMVNKLLLLTTPVKHSKKR